MDRDAIADRLVNYSDAIVAFSLVNSLAFLIALTEADVRCSLVQIRGTVVTLAVLFSAFMTVALVVCRRAEVRLRRPSDEQDEEAARVLHYFHLARIAVIWGALVLSLPLMRMALLDTSCP